MLEEGIVIDEMKPEDAAAVLEIYALGIASGQATFETSVPEWTQWDAGHLKMCRLVVRMVSQKAVKVIGWAALSAVSRRIVYAGVAEISIYIHPDYQRRGVGLKLMEELIHRSEDAGFWTLQSSMFPENAASIALHQKCGFRVLGRRERIARLNGIWRDTIIMERRSSLV